MSNLIALPNEILHNIFRHVDPVDITRLSLSCRVLYENLVSDGQLFRAMYFQLLDQPPAHLISTIDYESRMKGFVKFRNVFNSPQTAEETDNHSRTRFISSFITQILNAASGEPNSHNLDILQTYTMSSKTSITNLEALMSQSVTYNRALISNADRDPEINTPLQPLSVRQASAKLHVLYGKPFLLPRRAKYTKLYPYAVSMVYDLRNYTEETLWGPYLNDGLASVDWEKLEAVMLVLGHNMESFMQTAGNRSLPKGLWSKGGWKGARPYSYKSVDIVGFNHKDEEEGVIPADDEDVSAAETVDDPYNITGTWMRVVCFLDFHDLFAYNFAIPNMPADIPRPALQTIEAIRLISMELRVTHTEDPGPDDGQSHPVVYFEGVSRSLHSEWDPNANSNIRGNVRMTKEGEVRWQSISVYNGEERWRSEGIQIGGIQSARGVLGHWFDKDHDLHGPAGPTSFYKLSDQIKKRVPIEDDASSVWEGEGNGDGDGESESESEPTSESESDTSGTALAVGEPGHGLAQSPAQAHLDVNEFLNHEMMGQGLTGQDEELRDGDENGNRGEHEHQE
ncbi:hypothetical protein VTL71DRAFT_15324 [Oculimacula yallundae]|uniref:F-box domain-containing protein n=1 Tax=Oculimacula yallundae TaxID=86028 RepID=A0ABR4CIB7_9HELO